MLVVSCLGFAGTVDENQVINLSLKNADFGDKGGTGTMGVQSGNTKRYEYGAVNYSWEQRFNEDALRSTSLRQQIDEIGRAYTGADLSSVTNELVTATLIPGGYSYYLNKRAFILFDFFNVAGIRERVVPGREHKIEYSVNTIPRSFTVNTDSNSIIDDGVNIKGAYNIYNICGDSYISPIVLDMDGDGEISASGGNWLPHPRKVDLQSMRLFDINGNGFSCLMEWVGKGDGLLVEPKEDGTVDGSCLFGTNGGYDSGFEKLSLRDKNKDCKLNAAELKGLFVWQDANSNAKVDDGELNSVESLKITTIGTRFKQGYVGYFVQDYEMKTLWDWWPNYVDLMKMSHNEVK
jgi:hypothetical protein